MVDASFTTDANLRKSPPDLISLDGTLAGYRAVLSRRLPYLGNSLLIGLLTVALTSVVSAPAGHALAKLRPKGGGILSFPLLAAQMIPGVILAMGLCAILLSTGWINTIPGLVVADSTIEVPFAVLIFTAFMSAIPEEPLQAAATDGAVRFRTLWSTVLPASRNAVVTASLFAVERHHGEGGGRLDPATVLLVIAQKYVAAGITAGSVKE
jgi:multiple sugar transport system permease protein